MKMRYLTNASMHKSESYVDFEKNVNFWLFKNINQIILSRIFYECVLDIVNVDAPKAATRDKSIKLM